MADFIVVLVTASSVEQAQAIGSALVENHLAACANIIPGLQSIFRWKGELCRENEVLMMAKTRAELFPELASKVKELHSYEVPEIIALPIQAGIDAYLTWVKEETRPAHAIGG